jgi:guanylate kinase
MNHFIVTISGPSASGKTSLLRKLVKKYGVHPIISSTTRKPRPKEKDGVDYHFLNPEEFKRTRMVESVTFGENSYGLSSHDIEWGLASHEVSAVIVDQRGVKRLKELYPRDVFSVYIRIDEERAKAHLQRRDGKKKAAARFKLDLEQGLYKEYDLYDCIINNDRELEDLIYEFMNFVEALRAMKSWKVA